MKVAIIVSGNYFKAHIWFYTFLFDKLDIEYDIISWNRLNIYEPNVIQYNLKQGEGHGYFGRLYSYIRYRKFIINQLREVKYDKVFIFTIAIGVLLYPYLRKIYKKKYIFDIRDNSIITSILKTSFEKLINDSFFTVISSRGYLEWLPKAKKYYFAHNFPFSISREVKLIEEKEYFNPLSPKQTIVTIGTLRDYKENLYLIQSLENSKGFRVKFVGSGPAEKPLIEYVKSNTIDNVEFYGYYTKEKELELINDATFLNGLTGNDINSKTLTTNRFYLSVMLGIPMIVYGDTYQGSLSREYSLGCNINRNKPLKEQILQYQKSFDRDKYNTGRKKFIEIVASDMKELESAIQGFLNL